MRIEFSTRGILSAFFRQMKTFLVVVLFIMLSGLGYLTVAHPKYEAAGTLLVKFGIDATPDISRSHQTEVISQNDRRETMQSNMDILLSHDLLLSVVRQFDAEKLYPGISKAANEGNSAEELAIRRLWNNDLTVKSSQQSNTIEVNFINGDPYVAADFVRRLFAQFIARQSEVFNKPPTDFLDEQVKQAQAKLEGSQQALREFKAKNGISSFDDEMSELLRQKSDAGTAALESMDDAWARLSDLQTQERQMLATYRADSPQVMRVHAAVRTAEQQLHRRQSDLSSRTNSARTSIDQRIAKLESQRSQYNDLARQVGIDEENYKLYRQHGEEARINATLNSRRITPIVVIDDPVPQLHPVRPRRLLIVAICLLASMLFGLGMAMTFETFDQRFITPEHVAEMLRVPVMATFNDTTERRF